MIPNAHSHSAFPQRMQEEAFSHQSKYHYAIKITFKIMYQLLSPFQMLGILLKHCILVQKLLYSAEIQPTKIILSKQKQTKGKSVILCHPCSLYPFIKIYWWAVLQNSSVNKASYQYTERKNLPIFPQTAFKKIIFKKYI